MDITSEEWAGRSEKIYATRKSRAPSAELFSHDQTIGKLQRLSMSLCHGINFELLQLDPCIKASCCEVWVFCTLKIYVGGGK